MPGKKNQENLKPKYGTYPEAIIGALIVNSEGKVLLAKSGKWDDAYTIFGGHVEMNESLEDAVKREVREEAGIEVEIVDQLRHSDKIATKGHFAGRHMIFLDYLCRYEGSDDDVKFNDEYTGEYSWFSLEEAESQKLGGNTSDALREYGTYLERCEALDGWKRCLADFENYRKRRDAEGAEMGAYKVEGLLADLIPVLDNFHAAAEHIPEEAKDSPWVTGIGFIGRQFEETLSDHGVSMIEPGVGDAFDPALHEAMGALSEGGDENAAEEEDEASADQGVASVKVTADQGQKITKVHRKGFRIGDKVVRAAQVAVD